MREVLQIPSMEVKSYQDYTKAYSPTVLELPNGLGSARLYRPRKGTAELRNFEVDNDHLARLFGRFEEAGQPVTIIGPREEGGPYEVLDITLDEAAAELAEANAIADLCQDPGLQPTGFIIKAALPQLVVPTQGA